MAITHGPLGSVGEAWGRRDEVSWVGTGPPEWVLECAGPWWRPWRQFSELGLGSDQLDIVPSGGGGGGGGGVMTCAG